MKCEKCKNIPEYKKTTITTVKEILEKANHLKLFERSDDPFHAFYHFYYCPDCYTIYEQGFHVGFGSDDYVTFKCVADKDDFKNHHSELYSLASWLALEKYRDELLKQIKEGEGELTVYKFVSTLCFDQKSEFQLVKQKGYSSSFCRNIYEAKLYVSEKDLFERFAYGWHYFSKACLLKFPVKREGMEIHIEPTEYGDWFIPHTKEHVLPDNIKVVDLINNTEKPLSEVDSIGFSMSEYEWFEQKHKEHKNIAFETYKEECIKHLKEHFGIKS